MWSQNILDFMALPAGVGARPVDGRWTGLARACGPDRYTPIKRSLAFKHVSGLYTIFSGGMIWAAERLRAKTDVKPIEDLAVALFCLQQSELYYSVPDWRPSLDAIDQADRYAGPVLYILDNWHDHRIRSHGGWPVHPPRNMIGKLLTLIRFTLGKQDKAAYDQWTEEMVVRIGNLVPFQGHNELPRDFDMSEKDKLAEISMGPALPPHVLDRSADPDPARFRDQALDFMTSVDWESNSFLASPEIVMERGFRGQPYGTVR